MPEQEDIFYFTFHLDLVKSAVVKEHFQHIDCLIFRAGEELKRQQEKYRQYKHLFSFHKVCTTKEQLIQTSISVPATERFSDSVLIRNFRISYYAIMSLVKVKL